MQFPVTLRSRREDMLRLVVGAFLIGCKTKVQCGLFRGALSKFCVDLKVNQPKGFYEICQS
jgi:hypothetical protein